MQKSAFFNSINGDRRYKAEDFADYFASFIGNGVFPNPSTGLQVTALTGMTVTVNIGKAWINGYFFTNSAETQFPLSHADGLLKRIDRIVARWSLTDRNITLQIKKGSFSSTPLPPDLQRDADIYELALADIMINAGATTITTPDITDLRLNDNLCGIVVQTVREIDFTVFFEQYTAEFNEFMTESITEFNTWFATIQDILDENTAAHLLNLINTN